MKKLFFLVALTIGLLFSCSKDEDNLGLNESNLTSDLETKKSAKMNPYRTGIKIWNSNDPVDVRIAQHHVLHPSDKYFGLVSEKPARLIVKLNNTLFNQHPTLHLWITDNNGTVHKKIMNQPEHVDAN